jgi:hypothetical protein|nr:MAG TPA: hypothetical protein [Caudoviricetes sp.]
MASPFRTAKQTGAKELVAASLLTQNIVMLLTDT